MEVIQSTKYPYIVYKIEDQKTVPMIGHFISLIITPILIQITWS